MSELLRNWIADGLRGLGGEVDVREDGSVEALLDPGLARELGVEEFSRLTLEGSGGPSFADPKIQDGIERRVGDRPRDAFVRLRVPADLQYLTGKRIENLLVAHQGKVVFEESRVYDQTYLALFYRYSAVSDEKRDGMASVAINCTTGTLAPGFAACVERYLEDGAMDPLPDPLPQLEPAALTAIKRSARSSVNEGIADFLATLRKRMERDADRIHGYYGELVSAPGSPGGRKKLTPEDLTQRVATIRAEYLKKADDLRLKYLTRVSVEPVARIFATVPCAVATFTVMMGAARKRIDLPWNPLTRVADDTLCDICGNRVDQVRLCRELHWLCSRCRRACQQCGREYCPLCKPRGCVH